MSSSLRRPRVVEVRSRQLLIAIPCLLGVLAGVGCANSDDTGSSGGGGSGAAAGTSGAAGSSATGGQAATAGTTGTTGLGGQPGAGGQPGVAGKSGSGTAGTGGPGVGGETGGGGTRATGGGGSASSGAAGSSSTGAAGTGQTTGQGGHGGATTGVAGSAGTAGPAGTTGTTGGHSGTAGTVGGTAGTVGGTAGAAGGSTGAGGSSSSACNYAPVDPNATPQARNLLCYLYSIYGKNVLSGQQETSWSNPAGDISYYTTNVGKAPAILGGDYLYPSGTSSRALAYWNAGGLTMIRYHMGAPPASDTYDNAMLAYSSTQCNNVITAGTAENTSYLSKLDYVATEVGGTLQTGKAAVILALFHETQQGGWFWWSKCSATQFIALYKYTYSYLVNTKGLHNLVRLMPYSGSPTASFFPGKDSVDISGGDTYGTNPPFGSLYNSVKGIIGSTMPNALHETGTIPQPSTMFPTTAPWLLWNVWAGYETSANTVTTIKSAYASSYTITRDEIPNLK